MKGIKYVNLIKIHHIAMEMREVENGDLVVPVNNTLMCHTSFSWPLTCIDHQISTYSI